MDIEKYIKISFRLRLRPTSVIGIIVIQRIQIQSWFIHHLLPIYKNIKLYFYSNTDIRGKFFHKEEIIIDHIRKYNI